MSGNNRTEGDVWIHQTNDGGEIEVDVGFVTMHAGFETAALLTMGGGNPEDDGLPDNPEQWWGNVLETDPNWKLVSRVQHLSHSIPLVPKELRRIENAALQDFDWMIQTGAADEVTAKATIVEVKRLKLVVTQIKDGAPTDFEFLVHWEAQTS